MILDLEKLIEKYNLDIRGVIHIGAHNGGEYPIYQKIGIKNMLFFEPNPVLFEQLEEKVGDRAVNCALGDFNGVGIMYVADNNGQSSSLMEPVEHKKQYPHIHFTEEMEVDVCRLDDMSNFPSYNFINIDVQGYEIEVFKGAVETLEGIDYVMTEVNRAELYKDCAKVEQVDEFLGKFGFKRVEINWAGGTWGDAFYMKCSKIDCGHDFEFTDND